MRTMDRRVIVLGVALLVAGFALGTLVSAPPPVQGQAVQDVLVARQALPAGQEFTPAVLQASVVARPWPAEMVPDGVHADRDALAGRVLRAPIRAGEPIFDVKLLAAGENPLLARIPAGMRAKTLKVNEVSGLSGFVTPGSRVDLIATFRNVPLEAAGADRPVRSTYTKTVLRAVPVLAVGTDDQESTRAKIVPTVTVLVSPQDAETLTMLENEAKISLTLRGWGDEGLPDTEGSTRIGMLPPMPVRAIDPPEGPGRDLPDPWVVDLYLGDRKSVVEFF